MENEPKKSNGKRSALFGVVIIFIILTILCLCCGGFIFLMASIVQNADFSINEDVVSEGNSNEKIAVVEIHGEISQSPVSDLFTTETVDMTSLILDKLERVKNDSSVKAVILDVDSSGGEVYASELIYNKIKEVKATGKKIVALFRNTAASGAYYISAPADFIIASETTITGSIGVRLQTTDLSGLYEKLGIKVTDIVNSNGDFKIITNDVNDKNSEAYKTLETILDDVYDQFVDVIVEGRKLSKAEVITLADGRVYSGKAAEVNGLVDGLGYFEDAVEKATSLANLSSPQVIKYQDYDSYWNQLGVKFKGKLDSLVSTVPGEVSTNPKLLYILDF